MPPQRNRRIVFVVDDEKGVASTAALVLNHSGLEARSFVDPVDALQAIQAENPDLVLTDVVMPKMTGIQLAIQVKNIRPDCRILLFSGHPVTADLLEAATLQGYRFEILPKPAHPMTLLEKIAEMFGD